MYLQHYIFITSIINIVSEKSCSNFELFKQNYEGTAIPCARYDHFFIFYHRVLRDDVHNKNDIHTNAR